MCPEERKDGMIEVIRNSELGTFAGFPNDYLFGRIRGGEGFPDHYVKREIDRLVTKKSVCVDVGANLGYVSAYLSRRCRKVYSIEPQPIVFLQLCCNLFLNECFNVQPLNVGATSKRTRLDFARYQSGWVGTNSFSDYSAIPSIGSISLEQSESGGMIGERLDVLISERVDFIKIDAQGGDIDVILGAEELISRYRPVIVFEYEHDLSRTNYGRQMTDLDPFLERHGYLRRSIFDGNYILEPRGGVST
jgi:FkbM family methyltransferase